LRQRFFRERRTDIRQRRKSLVEDLPGRLPVREDEERRADDFEARAGGPSGKFRTDRQRRQHRTQVAHHPVHQVLGRLGERLEFVGRLAVMDEIPALDLEGDLVDGIEKIGHPSRQRILEQGHLVDIGRLSQVDRHHRSGRLELGIEGSQREKVLEDADELAEV